MFADMGDIAALWDVFHFNVSSHPWTLQLGEHL